MVFTSFNFFIFFPVVAVLYWITSAKYRWLTLLFASYFFYINIKPVFAVIIAGITLSTYFFTRLMDKTDVGLMKKRYMVVNIVIVLLPLFFFKYFSSINEGIFSLLESFHMRWPLPEIKLFLPIGISFYTFMTIGYIVDVYNEEIESEKNIGILALFVSFFPLLLSGPIERAKNMLPQFKAQRIPDYNMIVNGLKFMLWGYFMKLVVADRVGIYVDAVYNNISQHNGTSLLLASFLYPFQIYADLGGYSLVAIGVSKILGIHVMQNFKRPFFATSMAEFWRRWHISLISWLTDYIYIPLSFYFRKYRLWGIVLSLMITFLISGIWHGAAFTFLVWGLLQGLFLSIEALTSKQKINFEIRFSLKNKVWYIIISCLLTFVLFSASQIFARSANISDAFRVYQRIFTPPFQLPYKDGETMLYSFIAISILLLKEFRDEFFPERFLLFENKYVLIRWLSYYSVICMIFYLGVFGNEKYIYFQF
jgi:alginate O-acetyltransferase complex protein AlgI